MQGMLKVFESASDAPIQAVMDSGVYELSIPLDADENGTSEK